MSFQWIIDNAESLSIVKRPVVSQTVSRDQRVRAVSRGGNVWKFEATLPTGLRWNDIRGYLEVWEGAYLLDSQTINLSKAGYEWMTQFRGSASPNNSMTFKYTAAQAASNAFKFELGNMPGATGSNLFRAGDYIQPTGSKYVYTVAAAVTKGSAATQLVEVNRQILDTPSDTAKVLKVANAVSWDVICTQMPTWKFVAKDIVEFSGPFQFQEVI
jgi:hypothetical protein